MNLLPSKLPSNSKVQRCESVPERRRPILYGKRNCLSRRAVVYSATGSLESIYAKLRQTCMIHHREAPSISLGLVGNRASSRIRKQACPERETKRQLAALCAGFALAHCSLTLMLDLFFLNGVRFGAEIRYHDSRLLLSCFLARAPEWGKGRG